jgi:hypothetical protein
MDADLMSFGYDPTLLVGMQERGDRGNVETGFDPVLCQPVEDARDAHPGAVLTPRHAADRLAAVAQLAGLVVGIKG